MAELSPMMKQYMQIKEQNKDSILFFRLGDFYEMFFDDAVLASRELELVLTGRDCGQEEQLPVHSEGSQVCGSSPLMQSTNMELMRLTSLSSSSFTWLKRAIFSLLMILPYKACIWLLSSSILL